ncbi:hypothetical protein L3X38_032082 [Prunus dulcis]|uniref:Uncharacterized protein n=1 Tax=Prunus dulcis TaxID=3755 RepID=A0AAD4VDE8_PRUDU|nr:hypothetical protein L3X38_032082 [Prunus dulcis]
MTLLRAEPKKFQQGSIDRANLCSRTFEWRQPLVVDLDATPSISQKQNQISNREEAVKEKIILLQEKNIQRLNELVRSLREQLVQCRSKTQTTNHTVAGNM